MTEKGREEKKWSYNGQKRGVGIVKNLEKGLKNGIINICKRRNLQMRESLCSSMFSKLYFFFCVKLG